MPFRPLKTSATPGFSHGRCTICAHQSRMKFALSLSPFAITFRTWSAMIDQSPGLGSIPQPCHRL